MNLRESCLPAGWYPGNPDDIRAFLSRYSTPAKNGVTRAAIAPHAGWFYSGTIAAGAIACLDRTIETIVVIGGHLPEQYPPLFAMEDAVYTPLGNMAIDSALRASLQKKLDWKEDRFADNTVEVLLPMARFFFPKASLLWLRLPAALASFDAGAALAAAASELGRNIAVLASTDLTHYGKNYRFAPKGGGIEALRWVRDENDRAFIDAVVSGQNTAVLERAQQDGSSCSAGAVLGVMGFARAAGLGPARLLEHGTSADADKGAGVSDAFVGYASFVF